MPTERDNRIELVEETVSVETERSVSGRVRVSTSTSVVEEVVPVTLSGVKVEVIRERVDRVIDIIPETRVEGDTTIIPVVEEIVVVEKRLVLVEEIRIRKTATAEDVSIPVTLRKQTAFVERIEEQPQEKTP